MLTFVRQEHGIVSSCGTDDIDSRYIQFKRNENIIFDVVYTACLL